MSEVATAERWLVEFVAESNRIEGILRAPTQEEIAATGGFIELPVVTVPDLEALVHCFAIARLRNERGLDVRVGNYIAPPGGPGIQRSLEAILKTMHARTPWTNHVLYERLHPFTDGNGRSGRALWAWDMRQRGLTTARKIGFLHAFYYQTLAQADPDSSAVK